MSITSREFKHLIVEFGQDLKSTGDDLYDAIHSDISLKEGAVYADKARAKIADYSALLSKSGLDDVKRAQVVTRYQERVDHLKTLLAQYMAKEK